MFSRRPTFQIRGFVVPAVLVNVMNVEVGPEGIYLAVSVGGETMEVDVAVMSSS